jgi:Zn-dependent peptidase ImmA (M78 family)/transcriptional regulator with XRE-family HTH domain
MTSDLYQAIGLRIRRTREKQGMSQQELAQKMGYSSSATISHFEAGERKISIADLQRVAQILSLPVEYFLQDEVKSVQNQVLRFRALEEIRPTARETVVEFLLFAQKQGSICPNLPPNIKKLEPGKAAKRILEEVGIKQPPVSPREVADKLGVPVFEWDFPDEISGVFISDEGKVCIGVNEAHPRVRQRFSVAHELGHLVLDGEQSFFDFIGVESVPLSESPDHETLERKANQFAAALLMPSDWIQKDVHENGQDIIWLSKRYEVSQQALWFRLLNLKLVNESVRRSLLQ